MRNDPLVSLVMPTFNRPEFVRTAVERFQRQTWHRKELIILDDSDRAHQVDLSRFPNVRHAKLDARMPLGAKHDLGHDLAQGDVLGYLDDDDWFHPRRLVRQLQPIVLEEATVVGIPRVLVLAGGEWFRFDRGTLDPRDWVGNGITSNYRLPFHDGTAVYSRAVLRHGIGHMLTPVTQKVEFLTGITDAGEPWAVVSDPDLFVYIRHGKNTWQFNEQLVHVPTYRPYWFPQADLDFYRGVA